MAGTEETAGQPEPAGTGRADIDSDDQIVEEPSADAFTLSHIAQRRPDLWEKIYVHPNTDQSWRDRIREHLESEGLAVPELPEQSSDLGLKLSAEETAAFLQRRFGASAEHSCIHDQADEGDQPKRGFFSRLFRR